MVESSVKTISRPVIDRLPVAHLDEFACRQLDRVCPKFFKLMFLSTVCRSLENTGADRTVQILMREKGPRNRKTQSTIPGP